MIIFWIVLAIVLAYLVGALPGGIVLGRLAGVNLREFGSGNAGATNALRARGPAFGVAVFAFDCVKGVIAALLLPRLAAGIFWLPEACAAAVVVGHVFPVWFGFRGGKGFATALGAIVVLSPLALAPVAGVWILVLLLSGYVGLATLLSAVAYPIFIAARLALHRPALLAFAIFLALFLIYTHRDNIRRLAAGEEHRFERVRLLGRGSR
ncbi:MAG TPA: glycerol-3-phosphate 1-O-acyltransferase PlsY [Gammaproteobacteria bacterium]|nr:glycerol-3-phosphate 1-O-acyltransferase PlsY [Gammaproteobacteria bacterium]